MATEPGADVNLEGESAFMRLLGLRFEEIGPERVVASFETGANHHQTWGLVHGGVSTAVIETMATTGAYQAVKEEGQLAVGVNNVTDFLRPYQHGRLDVVAEPLQ
jgi:1,4-dihydroxy-2-naphthoyl-CoA hydrolase